MKKHFLIIVIILLVLGGACSSTKKTTSSSAGEATVENAIKVSGISEEYKYIKKNCSGCQVVQQSLVFIKKKPYDILEVRKANGETVEYFFDISSFYGKW